MKRAYAELADGQMHYRHAGDGGSCVLLLHMSGSSSDEYERVGDLLAERGYRVYAVDLLAFGASDRPPHYYSMTDHAGSIVGFLDALDIDSAYLYGNMATAHTAVHVALWDKKRVKGMMLAHPLYNPDPGFYAQKRNWTEFAVIKPRSDGSHLMEMWRRVAKYDASAHITDARCCCLHQAGEWSETLHWALFEDRPIGELLPDVAVHTVVVAYGALGDPTLLEEAAVMVPGGKFDIYEGGTPYIARSTPGLVVDMFAKHFSNDSTRKSL